MKKDINEIDIEGLTEKRSLIEKEIEFSNQLKEISNSSNEESIQQFKEKFKSRILEYFPSIFEEVEQIIEEPLNVKPDEKNPPVERVFNEDELDNFYELPIVNSVPEKTKSKAPEKNTRKAREKSKGKEIVSKNDLFSKQESIKPMMSSNVLPRTELKSENQNLEKNIKGRDNFIEGESFDLDKLNVIAKENQDLKLEISKLEELQRLSQERIDMSQNSIKKRTKHFEDITLLYEFDHRSFMNPNTADLFRILNEKEHSLKRLEKSYKDLQKSISTDDSLMVMETKKSANGSMCISQNSKSFIGSKIDNLNIDNDLMNFKRKNQQDQMQNESFINEIKNDLIRTQAKRGQIVNEE